MDDLVKLLLEKRSYTVAGQVMQEWVNPDGPLAVTRIEAQAAEIAKLRETGDRLALYSTHDDDCEYIPCTCGYTTIINAWKELGS